MASSAMVEFVGGDVSGAAVKVVTRHSWPRHSKAVQGSSLQYRLGQSSSVEQLIVNSRARIEDVCIISFDKEVPDSVATATNDKPTAPATSHKHFFDEGTVSISLFLPWLNRLIIVSVLFVSCQYLSEVVSFVLSERAEWMKYKYVPYRMICNAAK